MTRPFEPDWVIAPGETLREYIDESTTESALALACGQMPIDMLRGILAGDVAITTEIAQGLFMGTGISVRVWLNMEDAYRAGLAAGKPRL